MKNFILSLALLLSVPAFAGIIETCKEAKILAGENEDGTTAWQAANLEVTVSKVKEKLSAAIKMEGKTIRVTKGIVVTNYTKNDDLGVFAEILELAKISIRSVDLVTYYDFMPRANEEDSSGFSLMVFRNKAGKPVAKVFQAGWAAGLCK